VLKDHGLLSILRALAQVQYVKQNIHIIEQLRKEELEVQEYGGLNRSSGHIMKFSVFTKRHTTTLIYVPYLPKVPMYIVLHTCYAYLPRGSYVGTYCRYALYHGRCMSYIAMYGVPTYMSS